MLRQLTEIWDLESDAKRGAPLLAALRARVLSIPGGAVSLPPPVARSKPVRGSSLEKVFNTGATPLRWMQTGLARAKSIGAVCERGSGQVFGTCFLLDGEAIGLGTKELVLITASHLVGPGRAALKPAQTLARFEAVSPPAVIVSHGGVMALPADRPRCGDLPGVVRSARRRTTPGCAEPSLTR